jgi:hypothetical protein
LQIQRLEQEKKSKSFRILKEIQEELRIDNNSSNLASTLHQRNTHKAEIVDNEVKASELVDNLDDGSINTLDMSVKSPGLAPSPAPIDKRTISASLESQPLISSSVEFTPMREVVSSERSNLERSPLNSSDLDGYYGVNDSVASSMYFSSGFQRVNATPEPTSFTTHWANNRSSKPNWNMTTPPDNDSSFLSKTSYSESSKVERYSGLHSLDSSFEATGSALEEEQHVAANSKTTHRYTSRTLNRVLREKPKRENPMLGLYSDLGRWEEKLESKLNRK